MEALGGILDEFYTWQSSRYSNFIDPNPQLHPILGTIGDDELLDIDELLRISYTLESDTDAGSPTASPRSAESRRR